MQDVETWASLEFGHADLGDVRRTRRLVRLAAEVADTPAGTVSKACRSSASREGAFRLLENEAIRPDDVRDAAEIAGARRCAGQRRVFVAVDATSLTFTDGTGRKGFGAVGSWKQRGRGIHVMSALAVTEDGATLGLCGQRFWTRDSCSKTSHLRNRSIKEETESRFWLEALWAARSRLAEEAPGCTPWFQLDRGADCWQVFTLASRAAMIVTVRATHDRRLDEDAGYLWATVERGPVVATKRLHVPARPAARRRKRVAGRKTMHWMTAPTKARLARVEIRAATVTLRLKACRGSHFPTEVNAVLVSERGRAGEPVEWMLLTTHSVATRKDVLAVVSGYSMRWRIEEFHRAWKRGVCRVEDSQLRSRSAVFKWATILATVATRAMRLTQLARSTPDVPATTELTKHEIEAIFALRQPKRVVPDVEPTLGQAVRWIADLGGYIGPWNGPPGASVIGRGLEHVVIAARALKFRDKKKR